MENNLDEIKELGFVQISIARYLELLGIEKSAQEKKIYISERRFDTRGYVLNLDPSEEKRIEYITRMESRMESLESDKIGLKAEIHIYKTSLDKLEREKKNLLSSYENKKWYQCF